ncbi:MAG: Spy/CpxP family protein refolding chaperone [Blastocatellia bacterium]|nr:Spy/CpxP family protein refolding chaperone [Blastocatellia bacterium]
MTKRIMGMMMVAVLLVGGVCATAMANGKRQHGHQFAERRLERMAAHLNLTEDQQTKIKAVFDAEAPAMKQRHQQMAAIRQQIHEINSDGQYHEAEVSKLIGQQTQLLADGMAAREKARLQVFNILTPEQRQKAQEARQAMQKRHAQFRNQF